jgi:hypothetical protein
MHPPSVPQKLPASAISTSALKMISIPRVQLAAAGGRPCTTASLLFVSPSLRRAIYRLRSWACCCHTKELLKKNRRDTSCTRAPWSPGVSPHSNPYGQEEVPGPFLRQRLKSPPYPAFGAWHLQGPRKSSGLRRKPRRVQPVPGTRGGGREKG